MSIPLLVEFYNALPEDARLGNLDVPVRRLVEAQEMTRQAAEQRVGGKARRRAAVHVFCKQVQQKYLEGTLLRLLEHDDVTNRRAAVFALGLLGSPAANVPLALRLHDHDEETAQLASEALWSLWFRGDNPGHSDELHRIVRLRCRHEALAALDSLVVRAPDFAEALNQRAILYFGLEQFSRSVADCEAVLHLNPHHFGAQAGLGQCYLRLRKHRAALRAFQGALRINPRLTGINDAVKALENALDEDGR